MAAGAATMPAAGGTTCEQATGRMIDLLTAGKKDVPPDQVKAFHDMFVQHCQADAWSSDVRGCFSAMKTIDEGEKCADMMTDAQKKAIDAEMGKGDEPPPPPPEDQVAPAATAPPPPGSPANSTRGPSSKPKKSGDPCDGGN